MTASSARVVVIGGGLAGSEAAWQAARHGAQVTLYEMRPHKTTEAHRTGLLAELVCSNSFKSDSISNANGLLKLELRMMGSLLMDVAAGARVPAGSALCVDRDAFASAVTEALEACPGIEIIREEAERTVPDAVNILAPGLLASPAMAAVLEMIVGTSNLYFYDAVSPIIEADSINMSEVYKSSRYGKGDSTYVNIPLSDRQYIDFLCDLRNAERVFKREFEEDRFFSACMPIEELAGMGDETLAHGCMKPVGLVDPRTGKLPHAVAQLRPENIEGTLYGMVGFQTRLKHGEQERIFRKLPGLSEARFARLGSIHRNTFVNAPTALLPTLEHRHLEYRRAVLLENPLGNSVELRPHEVDARAHPRFAALFNPVQEGLPIVLARGRVELFPSDMGAADGDEFVKAFPAPSGKPRVGHGFETIGQAPVPGGL